MQTKAFIWWLIPSSLPSDRGRRTRRTVSSHRLVLHDEAGYTAMNLTYSESCPGSAVGAIEGSQWDGFLLVEPLEEWRKCRGRAGQAGRLVRALRLAERARPSTPATPTPSAIVAVRTTTCESCVPTS